MSNIQTHNVAPTGDYQCFELVCPDGDATVIVISVSDNVIDITNNDWKLTRVESGSIRNLTLVGDLNGAE